MQEKYLWHFSDEEYMKFAKQYIAELKEDFNYKDFVSPYNEERELVGAIIEEFQYLEAQIKYILFCAIEHKVYNNSTCFDLNKHIPLTTIVEELKNVLIESKIAEELKSLIKFRNYIVHSHYTDSKREEKLKSFPAFLFKIYEANDYISNVTNRIIGGATHIPNIFEVK